MIAEEAFEGPDGVGLRAALGRELRARYGGPGVAEPEWEPAAWLVARSSGAPVGCAALRELSDGLFELRRMYVVASSRGTGVADGLMDAAESRAAELGARRIILQCGTAQPEAMAFYRRRGYEPIEPFGEYAEFETSRCFGRDLPR